MLEEDGGQTTMQLDSCYLIYCSPTLLNWAHFGTFNKMEHKRIETNYILSFEKKVWCYAPVWGGEAQHKI